MEENRNEECDQMILSCEESLPLNDEGENPIDDKRKVNSDGIEDRERQHEVDQEIASSDHIMDKAEDEGKSSNRESDEDSLGSLEKEEDNDPLQRDDEDIDMDLDVEEDNTRNEGDKLEDRVVQEMINQEETETLEQLSQIKIKSAKSAWMLYMTANRERFKNENPNLKMTALTKLISESWKKLDEKGELGQAEKAPFIDEAEKDKARYQRETEDLKERIKKAQIREQLDNSESIKKLLPPNFYQVNDSNVVNQQASAIPLARLKKIIKLDDEVKNLSKDSLLVMDKALEYFVTLLAYETTRYSYPQRKSVKFDDLTSAIRRNEDMHFLKNDINSKYLKSISSGAASSKLSDTNNNNTKSGSKKIQEENKSIAKLSTFFSVKDKQ